MAEELEKTTPEVAEIVNDDEFTDQIEIKKPEPEVEEKKEEPKPEPEVEVEEEPEEEIPAEEPSEEEEKGEIEYDDPLLAAIEDARKNWIFTYKKGSRIKMIITVAGLALIVLAWILPTTFLPDQGSLALGITVGAAAAVIITLLVYNTIQKKKDTALIREYFHGFYDNCNAYTLPGLELRGDVDSRITKDEVLASGLYPSTLQIGSRNDISFTYEGTECSIADAASQKEGKRGLEVLFVGKYLRAKNIFEGTDEGLVIYFPGDSTLPPENLDKMNPILKAKRYTVYGSAADKAFLTPARKAALKNIRTDKLLVDVAIAIKPGRSYFALGYEDTLMVLPNEKPFNPKYVKAFKAQLKDILDLAVAFNK